MRSRAWFYISLGARTIPTDHRPISPSRTRRTRTGRKRKGILVSYGNTDPKTWLYPSRIPSYIFAPLINFISAWHRSYRYRTYHHWQSRPEKYTHVLFCSSREVRRTTYYHPQYWYQIQGDPGATTMLYISVASLYHILSNMNANSLSNGTEQGSPSQRCLYILWRTALLARSILTPLYHSAAYLHLISLPCLRCTVTAVSSRACLYILGDEQASVHNYDFHAHCNHFDCTCCN